MALSNYLVYHFNFQHRPILLLEQFISHFNICKTQFKSMIYYFLIKYNQIMYHMNLSQRYEDQKSKDRQNQSLVSPINDSSIKQTKNPFCPNQDQILENWLGNTSHNFEEMFAHYRLNSYFHIFNKLKEKEAHNIKKSKFQNKKPINRDILQFKIQSSIEKSIRYVFLFVINFIYLILVPYIYLFKEQIPKLKILITVNKKSKFKVYLCFCLDLIFSISWQLQYLSMVTYGLYNSEAEEHGLYVWSLFNQRIICLWLFYNMMIRALGHDISFLDQCVEHYHYTCPEDTPFFEKIKLKFQTYNNILTNFWEHFTSDDKQDVYEEILNLGFISHLVFSDNAKELQRVAEQLKNMRIEEKKEIYKKIMTEKNIQLYQEDFQVIMIQLSKKIENDIENSAKQLELLQNRNLEFAYFTDFSPYHNNVAEKEFFLEPNILNNNNKNHFRRFRDARKYLSHFVSTLVIRDQKNQSLKKFFFTCLFSYIFMIAFPVYASIYYYPISKNQGLVISLFIPKQLTQLYMIMLVYRMSNPRLLQIRITLMKMIKNLVDLSVDNNFIHPSQKYPNMKKWDICSTLTIQNWNNMRRLAMLMFYHECFMEERIYQLFAIYSAFIAIFFIGISDSSFTYKIQSTFLQQPICVSVMIFHLIFMVSLILQRINLDSQFNEQFQELKDVIHDIQSFFRELKCSPKYYYQYIPENINQQSLTYAISTKIKLRIQQRRKDLNLENKESDNEHLFQQKCSQLKKTFYLIKRQLDVDCENYSILFANYTKADTFTMYMYFFGAAILYLPFIIKAINKCLHFQT